MTSNFPGYSRIGGERSEPEWREYSLKRISLFRHVTIPHSTPRLRLVVPIVRIMLKSLANDWAKRRSAATVCVYEIGFDCCLHLKIAKYSSTPGPPSPNHDGRQLAGGRNRISWIPVNHMRLCVRSRLWHIPCLQPPSKGHHNLQDWGPQIHQNMQLFILEAFLAFKCYLNKLKIQILAHQEAFWGSNSFTSSWVLF